MTSEIKDKVINELIKGGIGVLFMGVVIYFLYQDNQQANKDIRAEIKVLRIETKECSKRYQDVLLHQVEENTKVMTKSNDLFDKVSTYFNKRRR